MSFLVDTFSTNTNALIAGHTSDSGATISNIYGSSNAAVWTDGLWNSGAGIGGIHVEAATGGGA